MSLNKNHNEILTKRLCFSTTSLIIWFTFFIVTAQSALGMEFREASNGGNCVGCTWLVAEGKITKNTPDDFLNFYNNLDGTRAVDIILDSPGGNLFAGMELGRLIRKLRFNTKVAVSKRPLSCKNSNDCPDYLEDFHAGLCESACAYAFMGGEQRMVADSDSFTGHPSSVIGLHQFYGDLDKSNRISKIIKEETYFSTEQFVSALILRYLTDMGVDPNVLSLAAMAGPGQMEYPSAERRKELKIDYEPDFSFGELDLEAYNGGLLGFSRPNFENRFNQLTQITFYCRNTNSLNVLFTIPKLNDSIKKILTPTYGTIRFNFNKGAEWYDHNNDDLLFNHDRVRQWTDAESSYINIILSNTEKNQLLRASVTAINLHVARAFGNYKAYIKFEDKSVQSLNLISKTCF